MTEPTPTARHGLGTARRWPALPTYTEWQPTCDTLHAHTQVLGKLAVALAPAEPQLGHTALRLTARGWETAPLPAPDGSGALVAALDLRAHDAVLEHSDGHRVRIPLTPNRSVGSVARDVLAAVEQTAGAVKFNPRPQEVPWDDPLDADDTHATYDRSAVETYFVAATRVALVLAELRAPYWGRSTPVNAWWGSFDLAVNFFSGRRVEPPSQEYIMRNAGNAEQIAIGWWPGDQRYPRAAFFAYAAPAPDAFAGADVSPAPARWDDTLGEYVLDWDDVIASDDPHATVIEFGRSVVAHACAVCQWDPVLTNSLLGVPPPIR